MGDAEGLEDLHVYQCRAGTAELEGGYVPATGECRVADTKVGWMTGLEPATTGATVQCSTC